MATKQYDNYADLITFTRASSGTALRPVGYGAELVTNGTFDTDVSGWSDFSSAGGSIAWNASGYVDVTNTTGTARLAQNIAVTRGNVYELTVQNVGGGSVFVYISETVSPFGSVLLGTVTSGTTKTFVFVAPYTSNRISISNFSAGTTASLDNVSVKEVIFDRATDPLVLFNHPNNVPRIEYDADGNRLGLLIEEQRTNLLLKSQEIVAGSNGWYTTGASTAANQVGPDGAANSASTITSTTSTGQHALAFSFGFISGTTHTGSFFVKKGTQRYVRVSAGNPNTWAARVVFDLDLGVVDTEISGTGSIQDFGNGWYRCSITGAVLNSASTAFGLFLLDNSKSDTFTGTGAETAIVFGAQLEEGSFPTSYIPTSGSTATRNPDIASIPTSAFGYNQKAGTVVVTGCKIDRVSTIAGTAIASLSKTALSGNDATRVFYRASGATGFFNTVSASQNVDLSPTGVLAAGQNLNIAFTYSEDDFATVANGGTVLTDTSGVVAEHRVLQIGDDQQYLNGHIKSIRYWPRRLTNAQLQELTS
jgi:hypothetical protein